MGDEFRSTDRLMIIEVNIQPRRKRKRDRLHYNVSEKNQSLVRLNDQ